MFQCFSWHNLRYIKNQQNLEVFNANIIVFLQGIMYAHNRRQRRPRARAHMCTRTFHTHTQKYIPSMFLGIDNANDSQVELFWLSCVDTLHKRSAVTSCWQLAHLSLDSLRYLIHISTNVSLFWISCQPGVSASWLRFYIPDPDVPSILEMHSEVLRYCRLIDIQCCRTQFCSVPLTGSTSSYSTSTSNWPRAERGFITFLKIQLLHRQ